MPATGAARSGRAQEIGVDLPVTPDQVGLLVVRPHARPRGPAHLLAEPGVAGQAQDGPRGGGRVGEAGDEPARPERPVRGQPALEQLDLSDLAGLGKRLGSQWKSVEH